MNELAAIAGAGVVYLGVLALCARYGIGLVLPALVAGIMLVVALGGCAAPQRIALAAPEPTEACDVAHDTCTLNARAGADFLVCRAEALMCQPGERARK